MAWRTLTLKLSFMGASPSVSLRLCPSPIGRAGSSVLCRRSFAAGSDDVGESKPPPKLIDYSEILEDIMNTSIVYIDPSSGRTHPNEEDIEMTRNLRRHWFNPKDLEKMGRRNPPQVEHGTRPTSHPSEEHANALGHSDSTDGSSKIYDLSADLAMKAKKPGKSFHHHASSEETEKDYGHLDMDDEQNEKMPNCQAEKGMWAPTNMRDEPQPECCRV